MTRMSGFGLVSMTQTSNASSTGAQEVAQVARERGVQCRLALEAEQARSRRHQHEAARAGTDAARLGQQPVGGDVGRHGAPGRQQQRLAEVALVVEVDRQHALPALRAGSAPAAWRRPTCRRRPSGWRARVSSSGVLRRDRRCGGGVVPAAPRWPAAGVARAGAGRRAAFAVRTRARTVPMIEGGAVLRTCWIRPRIQHAAACSGLELAHLLGQHPQRAVQAHAAVDAGDLAGAHAPALRAAARLATAQRVLLHALERASTGCGPGPPAGAPRSAARR